jgi:urease beta subunit
MTNDPRTAAAPPSPSGPIGAILHPEGDVPLAESRERRTLSVTNGSMRPVRVSSHYPFWMANARLVFDRDRARGFRLDVPAGASVRWSPGQSRDVELVALERWEGAE